MKTKKEQISKIIKIQVKHTQRNTDTQPRRTETNVSANEKNAKPNSRYILHTTTSGKHYSEQTEINEKSVIKGTHSCGNWKRKP